MSQEELIRLNRVTKTFRNGFSIERCSLAVSSGEFFCLIGPSGSGKSTILGLMGGWVSPDTGTITISGVDVTSVEPNLRPIRACFQKGGFLFPHLSVGGNVGYALHVRGHPKVEVTGIVKAALRDVGLGGFEERSVIGLSGGEVQRVSIARALVDPQPVLLLDEITAGLERPLREAILEMLQNLVVVQRLTVVCVTHDVNEAFSLCNRFNSRLGVLNAGKLEQVASPRSVYSEPVSSFVASLVGDVDLLPVVKRESGGVVLEGGIVIAPLENVTEGCRWLAVRPENIYLKKPFDTPSIEFRASVDIVDTMGPFTRIQARVNEIKLRILSTESGNLPKTGQQSSIFFDLSKARLLER